MALPAAAAIAKGLGQAAARARQAARVAKALRTWADRFKGELSNPFALAVFVLGVVALIVAAIFLLILLLLLLIIIIVLLPIIILGVLGFLAGTLIGQLFEPEAISGTPVPVGSGIPAVYWPMYQVAGGAFGSKIGHRDDPDSTYGVNPYLLASIHKQESGFSTNPTVLRYQDNGYDVFGPMQFKRSTWEGHKLAVRKVEHHRPKSYPLDRRKIPACRGLPGDVGCIHDDFDAIAAAAHKLAADGADMNLESTGTRRAVCRYIGACSEVDNCTGSVNQYCQVIPRAIQWQEMGQGAVDQPAGPMPGENGKLAWPLPPEYRNISSGFGPRNGKQHEGIDIPAPAGTPIVSAESGQVTHVCSNVPPCSGYGNFVCVEHTRGRLSTCYAHLSAFARGLAVNGLVSRGEVIGKVGATGNSRGVNPNHLHFEVRLGRYPEAPARDPAPYLGR